MSKTKVEDEFLEDPVDEFCYELAVALRRVLGLPTPWADFEIEEEEENDG